MKHLTRWMLGVALAVSVAVLPVAANASAAASPPATAKPAATPASAIPGAEQMAQTISLITGVAISPLLGMGAVGAWQYFQWQKKPASSRGPMPWYANPLFWLPALILVGLIGAKDILGPAMPSALKKPFDIAELIENKLSGLLAAGLFIPIAAAIFAQHPTPSAFAGTNLAVINGAVLWNVLLVPFAVMTFAVVWLVSHTINVLILISPFTTVDTALKAARLFLLSTVTVTSFSNVWVGAGWSLVVILAAYLLAGWSFRLMWFGAIYSWDWLTWRRRRFTPGPRANKMFTAEKIGATPIRTYGRLVKEADGRLAFVHRPWLVLAARRLELPAGNYVIGRGLVYPEVLALREPGAETERVLVLPPRYRTHEEKIAQIYGFTGVQDVGLLKGFKAIWNFVRGGPSPAHA